MRKEVSRSVSPALPSVKVAVAGLFFIAVSIGLHYMTGFVSDKGWLLHTGQRLLEGGVLYKDIIDTNPPLIMWIFSGVVAASHWLHMQDYHMLAGVILALIGASYLVCERLLRAYPQHGQNTPALLALVMGTIFITCASVSPFADREHIFMVLVFPYLLRWMPSLAGTKPPQPLRIVTGGMAAVGFCIKPHCAIVFACIQALYVLKAKKLAILYSLENLIIYTVATAYIASVYIFLPEYVHTILPMVLATYDAQNVRSDLPLLLALPLGSLCFAFADFKRKIPSPYRADLYYFLELCVATLLYALLSNGWGYTVYPLIVTVLCTVTLLALEGTWLENQASLRGDPVRRLFGGNSYIIVFSLFILSSLLPYAMYVPGAATMAFYPHKSLLEKKANCEQLFRKTLQSTQTRTYGAMSYDFIDWLKLDRDEGGRLSTRFQMLWMLTKFFIEDEAFKRQHEWILRYVAQAYAEDMEHKHPEAMFVEFTPDQTESRYLNILQPYQAFPTAWNHYTETELSQQMRTSVTPSTCNFRAYRR